MDKKLSIFDVALMCSPMRSTLISFAVVMFCCWGNANIRLFLQLIEVLNQWYLIVVVRDSDGPCLLKTTVKKGYAKNSSSSSSSYSFNLL